MPDGGNVAASLRRYAKNDAARQRQIARIAAKLVRRTERRADSRKEASGWNRKPMAKKEQTSGRRVKVRPIIAYDLETTRIAAGTPRPLYITAYCDTWTASLPIADVPMLADILEARFLTEENAGARFVAWNGNNFDVYMIAAALLHLDRWILRPYLTRSKNLRGLRVVEKEIRPGNKRPLSWEFVDGVAMTGLIGVTLKKFLERFAPDHLKLEAPDWERETFDSRNRAHVEYAERDSEGLYHGMKCFERIVMDNFGVALAPTIGNVGIKIFQRHMPWDVTVWEPRLNVLNIIRNQVMRGGYCFRFRQYHGPVWKYDINQAYAAAMRETALPSGRCVHGLHDLARCYIVKLRATHSNNVVPFYYRNMEGEASDGITVIDETWLTASEHKQLKAEGWKIEVMDGYFWDEHFSMRGYVDKLEALRGAAEGGPSGAAGTVFKNIGNHSYGKTVEQLDGLELVMANEKPEPDRSGVQAGKGWHDYNTDDEALQHIFFRFGTPMMREYHQPQLGAFITAHVRMVVRRAILECPEGWLYADTDCVIFDRPQKASPALDIDPKLYGRWKVEAEGEPYLIVAKKVYASVDGKVKHAKGMNVRFLDVRDFAEWLAGRPPEQSQVQRQNFVKVMSGADMFQNRIKVGQRMAANAPTRKPGTQERAEKRAA